MLGVIFRCRLRCNRGCHSIQKHERLPDPQERLRTICECNENFTCPRASLCDKLTIFLHRNCFSMTTTQQSRANTRVLTSRSIILCCITLALAILTIRSAEARTMMNLGKRSHHFVGKLSQRAACRPRDPMPSTNSNPQGTEEAPPSGGETTTPTEQLNPSTNPGNPPDPTTSSQQNTTSSFTSDGPTETGGEISGKGATCLSLFDGS